MVALPLINIDPLAGGLPAVPLDHRMDLYRHVVTIHTRLFVFAIAACVRMASEFDLPCPECGSDLERTLVPAPTETDDRVAVAECAECGDQYYPESALEQLD